MAVAEQAVAEYVRACSQIALSEVGTRRSLLIPGAKPAHRPAISDPEVVAHLLAITLGNSHTRTRRRHAHDHARPRDSEGCRQLPRDGRPEGRLEVPCPRGIGVRCRSSDDGGRSRRELSSGLEPLWSHSRPTSGVHAKPRRTHRGRLRHKTPSSCAHLMSLCAKVPPGGGELSSVRRGRRRRAGLACKGLWSCTPGW